MKVLFGFSAQFCGKEEEIVELPNGTTQEQIIAMFEDVIGIPYDDNCYFKRLE